MRLLAKGEIGQPGTSRYELQDLTASHSIPIHERVELPESWIPADSRVEIDAKITAGRTSHFLGKPLLWRWWCIAQLTTRLLTGYFTTGHRMTAEELQAVQGRVWEE